MDLLQLLIITMGLAGQVLIARKHAGGYVFWIVGNIALMFMYHGLGQFGLIALQVANTAIQLFAITRWIKDQKTHADQACAGSATAGAIDPSFTPA